MSLSPETLERVAHYQDIEAGYQPNYEVKLHIGSRTLVIVSAPAVMGKILIMERAAKLNDRFGQSKTLSTREPRLDDQPGMYRLLKHNDKNINSLLDRVVSGSLVQYKIHPTAGTFYGSEAQDHPHSHNMLATLSGGIDQLQQVGFGETSVIGLVSPPEDWRHRFNARYPGRHPQFSQRVTEAEISYTDLLLRDDVTWVINREGQINETATKVIRAAEHRPVDEHDEALEYVHRIVQIARAAVDRTRSEKT